MGRKTWIVVQVLLTILIPNLLAYASSSPFFVDNLKSSGFLASDVDVDAVKDKMLLWSLFASALLVGCKLSVSEFCRSKAESRRDVLIKFLKGTMLSALAAQLDAPSMKSVNVRIFTKTKWSFPNKTVFVIRNHPALADAGMTNKLRFRVSPVPEGLVGKCYCSKKMIYDDNLQQSYADYNLTKLQVNKTGDLRFVACVPLFRGKDQVAAIVTFDTTEDLKIGDQAEQEVIRKGFVNFSQFLFDDIPEYFR